MNAHCWWDWVEKWYTQTQLVIIQILTNFRDNKILYYHTLILILRKFSWINNRYKQMFVAYMGAQSISTFWDFTDYSPPGSSVHGIFLGRILEWVAFPFSRESFQPRDQTHISWVSMSSPLSVGQQGLILIALSKEAKTLPGKGGCISPN